MRRRDFTVNAMARRLATGEIVDPLNGREDLERRVLRTVSPTSFAEDPLRLVRALRFVSQLGFDLDDDDARADARRGGGRRARLGRARRRRPRRRRHGRALEAAARARARTRAATRARHGRARRAPAGVRAGDRLRPGEPLPLAHGRRAHLRGRAGGGRRGATRSPSGSPRSSTTSASRTSPGAERTAGCTTTRSRASRTGATSRSAASSRTSALSRLRYPNALRDRVVRIIRHHMFQLGKGDALRARRFLAKHGDELAFELVDHKEADYRGKPGDGRRAAARGHREARALPRGCSSASARSRTASPTWPSTATT